MPNFDGTGPNGLGPLTGRGMGKCRRNLSNPRGMGLRRRFFSENFDRCINNQSDYQDLSDYKKELERELNLVNRELDKE
ncbi:DUF5320 domain-containing protein [Candidatus Babeliales bacterium]|nr:DUF5320 domain-containing protein [Candidatus Babeliales bacterium]MCF7899509.1 DUF5320 domain-containing protein [Candidatus Babeliales bacterium]